MVLEQKLLGSVAWGLASDEDHVAGLPIVNKVGPASGPGQSLAHLLALDPVGLQPDSPLKGLQLVAPASVVDSNLLVVVAALLEPDVR